MGPRQTVVTRKYRPLGGLQCGVKNIRAVQSLIAANVLMYALQFVSNGALEIPLALWPREAIDGQYYFRPWQVLTYAFLHSPDIPWHLLFNMLGLWMFGTEIERHAGPWRLLACYFASVVTAAITQLFLPSWLGAPPAPTIGASGGVFGLLLAYALLFPHRRIIPVFPPIPMPAWVFAMLYATLELLMGVTGTLSGVAHFAHLGGMIGGGLVVLRWHIVARRR